MIFSFHREMKRPKHGAGNVLPCLHLGMPKTATTCIQRHLFARHSQIEYLGKYPGNGSKRRKFPHSAIQAMNELLLRGNHPRATRHCRRQLAKLLSPALAEGRVPVWSREGNTAGHSELKRKQARFFRRTFGSCKVLIFVRHPLKFIESMYFQNLKGFNKPDRAAPAWADRFGPPPRYFDIEAWLEAMWSLPNKGAFGHMLCAETSDAYAVEFGRENVRMFLFEQFAENPPAVIRPTCRFLGIDAEEGIQLLDGKRANDRWSVEQIERLKAIERSPSQSFLFRQGTWQVRQRMLGLDNRDTASDVPKARAEISPSWRERVLEFVRDDHRRLADDWGLPLSQYEYPSECFARAA